jgi:hypothetical protein
LRFFLFLVGLGFELRASHLQSSCSTASATPPVHFALVILEMGLVNSLPRLTSNLHPYDLSLPSSWDYRLDAPAPGSLEVILMIPTQRNNKCCRESYTNYSDLTKITLSHTYVQLLCKLKIKIGLRVQLTGRMPAWHGGPMVSPQQHIHTRVHMHTKK